MRSSIVTRENVNFLSCVDSITHKVKEYSAKITQLKGGCLTAHDNNDLESAYRHLEKAVERLKRVYDR